ncbi:amidohydrolase family protein [Oceanobacillus sp. J11TS1]|uniref:metal-dependent hydrolase family protein n=1 Tax=Oceanobacillus sp. J11TS1 TaxID=2807191 RepID=UPI001B280E62|nr:amidohydrolase family protein [Oceanobacillus sp. J11TS1]GIO24105.1 peptidase M38 [Oceanobacillus sp. J11TS1]
MLILRNCKFINFLTEDIDFETGDIIIEGDTIKEITKPNVFHDEHYQEIDVQGKTVMPGIIDMHVHLSFVRPTQAEILILDGPSFAFDCLKYAQHLLNIGVTTARDVGDDKSFPTVALRNAVDEGIVKGPRVIASGSTLCPHEPGVDIMENLLEYVTGPMEMRRLVRQNFQKGADFIKLYGSGSMMAFESEPGVRILEEDEIKEAVKIASLRGSHVAMHAHGTEAIDVGVKAGVRTIEHASFISDDTLKYLEGKTDQGIVPTLAILQDLIYSNDYAEFENARDKVNQLKKQVQASLSNAANYDVLIGWGTDVSYDSYKKNPCSEFKMRKEFLGYENKEILKQATINSAKLLMLDDKIGTVKANKQADLIIVDGDPVEDISVMYDIPSHVIKSGEWIR